MPWVLEMRRKESENKERILELVKLILEISLIFSGLRASVNSFLKLSEIWKHENSTVAVEKIGIEENINYKNQSHSFAIMKNIVNSRR